MTKQRTGLEQLQKMIAAGKGPPIGQTLGFRLTEAGDGWAVFEGNPTKAHYNPAGTVHGGWAAAVLDSALGCAIHSCLPPDQNYGTVELKVNYVRPMTDRTGTISCRGEIVHVGRRLAVSEARLTGPDGKLYATGSCTCMVYE
jgi:uncharacterized protein (TIGR00369 family)